jgi:hypothetical protein
MLSSEYEELLDISPTQVGSKKYLFFLHFLIILPGPNVWTAFTEFDVKLNGGGNLKIICFLHKFRSTCWYTDGAHGNEGLMINKILF